MPYVLVKTGGGYKVGKRGSKKTFSKKVLTKEQAVAQLRAIYANTKGK